MLNYIAIFAAVMCGLNWLLFVALTVYADLPELKKVLDSLTRPGPPATGMGATVTHAAIDPTKLAAATGALAGAFKKAGAAPTAAALSVLFILIAALAAGIDKIK
jgi:hypothetical protein